jgi:AcrR family transcriptional regulator
VSPRTKEQTAQIRKERRRQILDAARRVFAEKGFSATRVSDIASRAGVSQGTIYWYFKSKEELFMTLLEEWVSESIPTHADFAAAPGTVEEKVRRYLRAAAKTVAESQDLLPIYMEFLLHAFRDDSIRERFKALFAEMRSSLMAIVREGGESGAFRDDLNASHLASLVIAVYDGLALQWAADPEAVDWQGLSATFAEVLLKGLRKR